MTKVSELTGPKLAEWTARACRLTQVSEFYWKDADGNTVCDGVPYEPHINGTQAMELVEKHYIHLSTDLMCEWIAGYRSKEDGRMRWNNHGDTPMEAICRAVVASVYDEEVPDQ